MPLRRFVTRPVLSGLSRCSLFVDRISRHDRLQPMCRDYGLSGAFPLPDQRLRTEIHELGEEKRERHLEELPAQSP